MLWEKVCEHDKCQKIYQPTRRWQKYCSVECRNAVFYARKFTSTPLERLEQDLEEGPTKHQEADWAARKKPDEPTASPNALRLIKEAEDRAKMLKVAEDFRSKYGSDDSK